ncbi:MAG: hypothetical protein JNK63_09120 [Chthonomonas sp.]|nr:hypothetical protein [Chthonomonas sp.]
MAEWNAPQYYVPRDCPRMVFWAGPETSASDCIEFLGSARRVMAVEPGWLQKIHSATIVRYEFEPGSFACIDEVAGTWVSRETLAPTAEEVLMHLPDRIAAEGIELRAVENLFGLSQRIAGTTLRFSGNRLRNCLGA